MSFGKAKRFVYKTPDVDCSPADYLINLQLNRGHSISKDPRFRKSKINNDSMTCSRSSHSHSSDLENNCSMQSNKHMGNENKSEFSRSDALRKSVKMNKKGAKAKTIRSTTTTHYENDQAKQPRSRSYDTEESVDDDYGSMTSSDDNLATLDDYELNEVCKAMRNLQQKKSTEGVPETSNSFQNKVFKKLEKKDQNAEVSKEDGTCLESFEYHHKWNYNYHAKFNMHKNNNELIRSAIKKLSERFEKEKQAILINNEELIIKIVAEMYATNNDSNNHINTTAEELMHNIESIIDTTGFELNSEMEMDDIHGFDEQLAHQRSYHFDGESLHNVIVDYLNQTHEISQEMEQDLSDITLRCMDTQQMLDTQGALLDEMKNGIRNLKSTL